MVLYETTYLYINDAATLKDKITRIDAVINALLDTALKAATNDHISEYSLDDGQVKIATSYKGTADVFKSIRALESLKVMYISQLNGSSVVRLVDHKSFRR